MAMGPPSSGRCPVVQVSTKLEPDRASVTAGRLGGTASEGWQAGAAPAGAMAAAVTVEQATAERHRPTTAPQSAPRARPTRRRHPSVWPQSAVVAGPIHEIRSAQTRSGGRGLGFARPGH